VIYFCFSLNSGGRERPESDHNLPLLDPGVIAGGRIHLMVPVHTYFISPLCILPFLSVYACKHYLALLDKLGSCNYFSEDTDLTLIIHRQV